MRTIAETNSFGHKSNSEILIKLEETLTLSSRSSLINLILFKIAQLI